MDPTYPLSLVGAVWKDADKPLMLESFRLIEEEYIESPNIPKNTFRAPKSIFHDKKAVVLGNIDAVFNLSDNQGGYISPNLYTDYSFLDIDGSPGGYAEYIQWKYAKAKGYLLSRNAYKIAEQCPTEGITKGISIVGPGIKRILQSESVNVNDYAQVSTESYVYDRLKDHIDQILYENSSGVDIVVGSPIKTGADFWNNLSKVVAQGGNVVIESISWHNDLLDASRAFDVVGLIHPLSGGHYVVAHKNQVDIVNIEDVSPTAVSKPNALRYKPSMSKTVAGYLQEVSDNVDYIGDINWNRTLAIWNLPYN